MPMRRELYPDDWEAIALAVKEANEWRCQECGKQCRQPGEPHVSQKFTLTVAHLNHDPADCRPESLRAMCAPCHLRYDAAMHRKHATATRYARRNALNLKLAI